MPHSQCNALRVIPVPYGYLRQEGKVQCMSRSIASVAAGRSVRRKRSGFSPTAVFQKAPTRLDGLRSKVLPFASRFLWPNTASYVQQPNGGRMYFCFGTVDKSTFLLFLHSDSAWPRMDQQQQHELERSLLVKVFSNSIVMRRIYNSFSCSSFSLTLGYGAPRVTLSLRWLPKPGNSRQKYVEPIQPFGCFR